MTRVSLVVLVAALGAAGVGSAAPSAAPRQVRIVHAQRGCHIWSVGAQTVVRAHVSLHRGARLTVVNDDLDMHQLVQVAGPRVPTGPFMMMSQRVTLRFRHAGRYRFRTRVADMRGMPEAKTTGPDHKLVLVVHVR